MLNFISLSIYISYTQKWQRKKWQVWLKSYYYNPVCFCSSIKTTHKTNFNALWKQKLNLFKYLVDLFSLNELFENAPEILTFDQLNEEEGSRSSK